MKNNKQTCSWPKGDHLLAKYHDKEWGVPLHNDKKLFEFLILEGFQAGLSWLTILKKRENFRKAFDKFDFNKVVKYDQRKINSLLKDSGIIRIKLNMEVYRRYADPQWIHVFRRNSRKNRTVRSYQQRFKKERI
jgi:DNA-3-methyladenine glycosylase I